MHEAIGSLRIAAPLTAEPVPVSLASAVVDALLQLGVREAFGVIGGAAAALARALSESEIRFIHCRHESGAAFAATELSLATGRPAVVFTTTGPGITNAVTGLLAARWEGAKVVLVSAATSAPLRGRRATQETGPETLPHGIYTAGGLFHEASMLASPAELEPLVSRLRQRFARPEGCVAHIALPIALQSAPASRIRTVPSSTYLPTAPDAAIDDVVERLASGSSAVWLGFGARDAAPEVRALAEALGAPVMTSPRAKGLFPERHPLWLGVTGVGGHPSSEAWMSRYRPAHVLVLGSRLGESTSFWSPAYHPTHAFIHVDVDPTAFGAAYPEVPTTVHTGETCGVFSNHLVLDDGAPRIRMQADPRAATFLEDTLRYMPQCCGAAAAQAGVTLAEIDAFVLNTPVAWFTEVAARTLSIDPARTVTAYPFCANVGPALMPINLLLAAKSGRVRPGDLVMLYGVGSGSTATASVLRWGDVALGEAPAGLLEVAVPRAAE